MDDLPLWLDVNEDPSNDYFMENLWHHPNQLSEEMVQYMSRPKTHSKGVTVISHLKPESLKYNLTQTVIL